MIKGILKKYYSSPTKKRLVFLLVGITIILIVFESIFIAFINYKKELNNIEKNYQLIEKTNKEQIVTAIWNLDTPQITSTLNGLMQYPGIQYASFTSDDTEKIEVGKLTDSKWTKEKHIKLYKNETYIGTIYLYSDLRKSFIENIIKEGIITFSLQMIQLFFVLIIFIYVLNKLVLGPLSKLDAFTYNLSKDFAKDSGDIEFESRIPVEFRHLAKTLLKLKSNLLEHIQSLEDYQVNLENIVNDRTHQLNQAVQKAESANDSKSQFLSNVTHELKTPLNAVITLSKILAKNKNNEFDEKSLKKIKVINSAGNELLELVNELLDLSKIEAGEVKFRFMQFSLSDQIEHIVEQLAPTAESKKLDFKNLVSPSQHLTSDPGRISQIIKNIISNAIKFTQEGFVKIELIESEDSEYKYIFRVTDSGIGIKESELVHIFDRYSQLHNNTLDVHSGSGLGLCISKMLSDKLLCDIEVKSNYGEGTIFSFYLKDLTDYIDLEDSVPYLAQDIVILKNKKIVLVDDDEATLQIVKEILLSKGAKVFSYASPVDMLEDYENIGTVDIYLLDYHMPQMNGARLANNIYSHPVFKKAPIFILTGSPSEDFVQIVKNSKVSLVLDKPFNLNEFVKAYKNTKLPLNNGVKL